MNIEPTEPGTEGAALTPVEHVVREVTAEPRHEVFGPPVTEVPEPVQAFDPFATRLDPDVLQTEANREVDADVLRQAAREDLAARAAAIAGAPGFDWTRIPVSRPSQKQAKARKSKARQQRNARKHNRKK